MMKEINFKYNNLDFKLIQTDKYKITTGVIFFIRPLEKEDFTYYTLLNRLIGSCSVKYPTKNSIVNKEYELYDCSVYMTTNYAYKSANTSFVFSTISDKIVNNKTLTKDVIQLLHEIMMNPLIEDGGFSQKNFLEEKRGLESDIKNLYNNKKRYSLKRLLETIAPNDIISASSLGDLEVLNKITPQSLYEFYLKILNESYVRIGVIGDITEEEVKDCFSNFNFNSINNKGELYPSEITQKGQVSQVTEKQDIIQAKLLVGFRFNINHNSTDKIKIIVFNSMFGGMFGSSLFMNIRENKSLAYDIASDLYLSKNILYVSCGIDSKNVELTSDLIIKELEQYKQGNIDESLLDNAKNFIINDLNEMSDYPFSTLTYKMREDIYKSESIEETIEIVKKITVKDIIEISNKIILDSIFTLTPGDEND